MSVASRVVGATVEETVERIRRCAARGWSCLLRRPHVQAWLEATWGHRAETWPLETPRAVQDRLERAWRRGAGVRLSPDEVRQVCGAGAS